MSAALTGHILLKFDIGGASRNLQIVLKSDNNIGQHYDEIFIAFGDGCILAKIIKLKLGRSREQSMQFSLGFG
jgi:hypothetical protein